MNAAYRSAACFLTGAVALVSLSVSAPALAAPGCLADFNRDGSLSVQDIFDFLAAFYVNDEAADLNGSGTISTQDIFDFLAAYFEGCA